jgi:hypothetical protein
MNGGMVCKADANFAAHASLQPDARGTGVAQDSSMKLERVTAEQIRPNG